MSENLNVQRYSTKGAPMPNISPGGPTQVPPPSYDEAIGLYKTSLDDPYLRPDADRLAYIDIMPRCTNLGNAALKTPPTFEPFSHTMVGANVWLKKHPGIRLYKCEVVEKKVDFLPRDKGSGVKYDFDTMLRLEPQAGQNIVIKGVRLWMIESREQSVPAQELSFFDVKPDKETVRVTSESSANHFLSLGHKVMGIVGHLQGQNIETLAGLKQTVAKLNEILKAQPLKGTILNIQPVLFRRNTEATSVMFDSDSSCDCIDQSKARQVSTVLRVFFISGPSVPEEIGFHSAIPALKKLPELTRGPVFHEQFDTSIATAQTLNQLQGRRIVNIEQRDVRYFWKGETVYVAHDSMDDLEGPMTERYMVKTQLTFFATPLVPGPNVPPPPQFLTYRIFPPHRLGLNSYENMAQTLHRVLAWLKVTGLRFYAIDSFEMNFTGDHLQGVNIDKSAYLLPSLKGHTWVRVIRLFFPTGYQEPPPSLLPLALDWRSQNDPSTSTCRIL